MAFQSKYGVARHIYIPVPKAGSANHAVGADWTPAAGDVKISKDGGAAANVTNLPTAIAMGNSAIWDFSLTATEMQAAQVVVTVADSATKAVDDTGFEIETYGNASAQHAFDFGTATQSVTVASIANNAITAAAIATDAIDADAMADGAITAATFAAGAIDSTAIAADAIGSSELAASAVTEIQSGLSTLDAAGVRAAVGLASANLDTQLAAIVGYIDTEVAAILAAVDTEVAAIKAKTDLLTFGTGNRVSAILDTTASVTAAAANRLADFLLRRDISNTEDNADAGIDSETFRSLYGAVCKLVNLITTLESVGKLSIYKSDDTTVLARQTLSTDPSAEPITAVNTD